MEILFIGHDCQAECEFCGSITFKRYRILPESGWRDVWACSRDHAEQAATTLAVPDTIETDDVLSA